MHVKYKLSAAWSYLCMYLSLGADIGIDVNGGVEYVGSAGLRRLYGLVHIH